MDIRCPVCLEPYEMDTIHDVVTERWPDKPWKSKDGTFDEKNYDVFYRQVQKEFRLKGCEALGGEHSAQRAKSGIGYAIYDLMGDDFDGAASAFEDAEAMGLLE